MYKTSEQPTRRLVLLIVSALLVLALLAAMLPLQRVGAVGLAVTCSTYHTVASGETLSALALKYNVTVEEIATANNLSSPYQIFVGQRLCIPGSSVATAQPTAASTSTGPDFTMKAGPYPNTFELTTSRYPKSSPHYVRITRIDEREPLSAKVGTIKTNKSGVATRVFRIPQAFRDAPMLVVCLKNAFTDSIQCKNYFP